MKKMTPLVGLESLKPLKIPPPTWKLHRIEYDPTQSLSLAQGFNGRLYFLAVSLYKCYNGKGDNSMQKSLTAIGNSLGIVIEKPILELLGITKETVLEMRTDGERLIIEPIKSARAKKLSAASERVQKNHAATFRKLAK
jgi:antitoxin MazE